MEKKLDITVPQKVSYCVPLWLRDEQIKSNITKVKGRIQPGELRPDSVAVVGYGPSLKETWEQVREFKHIITCSGSHKFLLERGIVPTWHIEVDPREYKIELLGPPHRDVEYLVASTCHPKYLDHLSGHNVRLWHVFDGQEEAQRILPAGEWSLTGGCDVGLRAMVIARFLGFTDIHVFGIDGSSPTTDKGRHAAAHPNPTQAVCTVDYDGKTYYTTPAMAEAARSLWHELDMLPDVTAKFYGDGLVQGMAKLYKRPEKHQPSVIASQKMELISAPYRELNAKLHQENLAYGVGGGKHAETVLKITKALETTSVLDYGCGKGYLAKALPFPIWEYDPAIPEKAESPRSADVVVCTDVLEHIEPDKIRFVLKDLQRCIKKVGYFTIHTGPAQKTLPDGRNTHLIQRDIVWWKKQLKKYLTVGKISQVGPELYVVVGPPTEKKKAAAVPMIAGAA